MVEAGTNVGLLLLVDASGDGFEGGAVNNVPLLAVVVAFVFAAFG